MRGACHRFIAASSLLCPVHRFLLLAVFSALGSSPLAVCQTALQSGIHPSTPQPERKQKDELTEEISRRLPPTKRAEVKHQNYIDDYIFSKMERDHVPH